MASRSEKIPQKIPKESQSIPKKAKQQSCGDGGCFLLFSHPPAQEEESRKEKRKEKKKKKKKRRRRRRRRRGGGGGGSGGGRATAPGRHCSIRFNQVNIIIIHGAINCD